MADSVLLCKYVAGRAKILVITSAAHSARRAGRGAYFLRAQQIQQPRDAYGGFKNILNPEPFSLLLMLVVACGLCIFSPYRVRKRTQEFNPIDALRTQSLYGRRQPCAIVVPQRSFERPWAKCVAAVSQRGTGLRRYTYGPNGQH